MRLVKRKRKERRQDKRTEYGMRVEKSGEEEKRLDRD